jgi:hypothetical protein
MACSQDSGAIPEATVTSTAAPPTPTSTSTREPTATPRPDPLVLSDVDDGLNYLQLQLQEIIDSFAQRVGGNFAVAVTDLQTNQTIHVNGESVRIPGCTMNFFVLLQVAKDLQAGQYPESAAGSLMAQTVWASDPGTSHKLMIQSGGGSSYGGLWKVNNLIHNELGLDTAVYDHPPANDTITLVPGKWQDNAITPLDFNRALTMLYHGEILNAEWTMYLIDKMSRVKPGLNHLIPAGVTDPAAIKAHKNGYIDYVPYIVDNDIGIVAFTRGDKHYAYVLTFWSQDNPWVLSDAPLGANVSKIVWDYFNAVYT